MVSDFRRMRSILHLSNSISVALSSTVEDGSSNHKEKRGSMDPRFSVSFQDAFRAYFAAGRKTCEAAESSTWGSSVATRTRSKRPFASPLALNVRRYWLLRWVESSSK
jgi:hypothetical protein